MNEEIYKTGRCVSTFLNMWEKWGEPFSNPYTIKDVEYWNKFWESNKVNKTYSQKEIYISLRNIHFSVNHNSYNKKFISRDPCKFLQSGMLCRGLDDEFIWECGVDSEYENDSNLKIVKDDVYD